MRSIIGKIIRTILVVILTILVIFNVVIFIKSVFFKDKVPGIFGYKPFIVMSDSMKGVFEKGDLIFVEEVDSNSLEIGDIIAFRQNKKKKSVITHRILSKEDSNGKECFITKGDDNKNEDNSLVCSSEIEGKYVGKIAGLGNIILFIHKPLGFCLMMTMIIIVCILIYLSGNDEEKDNLDVTS